MVDNKKLSILGWVLEKNIVNEKGAPLDFTRRLYLIDILRDWSRDIVIKKCAQVGGSLTFNIKIFFAAETFGWNIIYTFPTDSDTREFVQSKTNKFLQANPHVFGKLDTDSVELKEVNDRFVFFKGTVSKTAAIATSADVVVHDEASRSHQPTMVTYQSRLQDSDYKGTWTFSNPTTEKDIIDQRWQLSDQKEWFVTCPLCHEEQQLKWPDSVDIERECYICVLCKAELPDKSRALGRWRPTGNGIMSGYHISSLMNIKMSASSIIEASKGDQEYFYNFLLGEPYNPGDFKVTKALILDNWTPHDLSQGTSEYYLGVDVGNIKHYVLGSAKGIFLVGTFTKWEDLDTLMQSYKPILCIDAMPENQISKYYVANYQNAMMCYLNRDKEQDRVLSFGTGENNGIVHADRNRLIELVLDEILRAKILFSMPSDTMLRKYIEHWESLRRVKVLDSMMIERYVWESVNATDHFCFATFYYFVAMQSKGNGGVFGASEQPQPQLVKETMDGPVINMQEVLERNGEYDG